MSSSTTLQQILDILELGQEYRFSQPISKGLKYNAGLYSIWNNATLKYIGETGNLYQRLKKHRSGSRSGDKFNIYVFDRIILKQLTTEQIDHIASGVLNADSLIRKYVQQNYSYRFVVLSSEHEQIVSKKERCEIETLIRKNGLNNKVAPYFQVRP